MHNRAGADNRISTVVERDWINDTWVVTRALSASDGSLITREVTAWPCDLYDAAALAEMLWGADPVPAPLR